MLENLILFAQEKGADPAQQGPASLLGNPMMLPLILIAVFFFLVILPAQRKQKKEQEIFFSISRPFLIHRAFQAVLL